MLWTIFFKDLYDKLNEMKYKLKKLSFIHSQDFLVKNRSFRLIFVTNDNESLVIIGNHWYLFLRKINFYHVKKTIEAEL